MTEKPFNLFVTESANSLIISLFNQYKHMIHNKYLYSKVFFTGLVIIFLSTCQPESPPASPNMEIWKFSGSSMGTSYHVSVRVSAGSVTRKQLQQGIKNTIDTVDRQMSTYKPNSELSLFNRRRSTSWQPLSPALFKVLSVAQQVSKLSDGAFDITVAPLVDLWGFGPSPSPDRLPTATEIKALLPAVGFQRLRLQSQPPAAAKQLPNLQIDLSAIAKGFAVDQVAGYLKNLGLSNYLVEIGGEVRGSGSRPGGQPWRVALEAPVTGQRRINRVITLHNFSLATSGDYRNYFEKNGVRYSHTINPRTGYPIRHKLASVSVLASNTMLADALATALMVAGPKAGYALSSAHAIAARFLVHTGTGFKIKETVAWQRQVD